jgi:hypothetical protein
VPLCDALCRADISVGKDGPEISVRIDDIDAAPWTGDQLEEDQPVPADTWAPGPARIYLLAGEREGGSARANVEVDGPTGRLRLDGQTPFS